jgi:RNA polymerase sigma factor (sigma-70 family)
MPPPAAVLPELFRRLLSGPLSECGDRELLDRFAERRDERAFDALLGRHGPMVLGVCRRSVGDLHLADDVFQATFLVLAREAGRVRRRDSVASFLHGVARRLASKALRVEAARARREAVAAERRAGRDPTWSELLLLLDEELARLPDQYREPLLLCYLQGCTQDEAAARLGWSLSTLRRRLDHGRDLLRERLVGLGVGVLAPLTPTLREATLSAVFAEASGVAVSASVLALADTAPAVTTPRLVALLAMVALVATAAVAMQPTKEPPKAITAPEPPAAEPPLPRGAVARLGTLSFRHGRSWTDSNLTFTADGKRLVSAGGGWVRLWNASNGEALVTIGDGGRGRTSPPTVLATRDGQTARILHPGAWADGPTITWPITEYDLKTGKVLATRRITSPRWVETARGLQVHVFEPRDLSPDGKYLVVRNDSGLLVFDATAGRFLRFHEIQRGKRGWGDAALAFHPDGKSMVMGHDDHQFTMFDLASGKPQRSFGIDAQETSVHHMAISPDGKWLATLGSHEHPTSGNPEADGFLRLWDLRRGTVVRQLPIPRSGFALGFGGCQTLLFTPDSRTVIAGFGGRFEFGGDVGAINSSVRTWEVATGKAGLAWTGEPSIGATLAVRPDGEVMASMNEAGVIRLWNMRTGKEITRASGGPSALEALAFGKEGNTVLTVARDLSLREIDAATGRLLREHRDLGPGRHPRFSPSGMYLYAETSGVVKDKWRSQIRVWHAKDGKVALDHEGYASVVSPDDERIAVADGNGETINVLDLGTKQIAQTIEDPKGGIPKGFSDGGRKLVLVGNDLSEWDLKTGKQVRSWSLKDKKVFATRRRHSEHEPDRIMSLAFSRVGSRIAFGLRTERKGIRKYPNGSGLVMVFEMGGNLLREIDLGAEVPRALVFSPDGRRLACGGQWATLVWDIDTGKETHRFEGHRGQVNAVAFRPDGKRLATASEDSTVLVWDVSR